MLFFLSYSVYLFIPFFYFYFIFYLFICFYSLFIYIFIYFFFFFFFFKYYHRILPFVEVGGDLFYSFFFFFQLSFPSEWRGVTFFFPIIEGCNFFFFFPTMC